VSLALRDATLADAEAIAALHAASWRSAYRGIMPDAYLDGDCATERSAYWRARLAQPLPGGHVLLAHDGEALLGFIAVWPDPQMAFDAYLDNLHVAPGSRGRGIGRELLGAAARRLADEGRRTLCLWVYDANRGAFDFYRALGAAVVERGIDQFAGRGIPHTKLAWEDSARLAAACGH
jgi:ribosomal protein S18 acetylase RimI-like enzyme